MILGQPQRFGALGVLTVRQCHESRGRPKARPDPRLPLSRPDELQIVLRCRSTRVEFEQPDEVPFGVVVPSEFKISSCAQRPALLGFGVAVDGEVEVSKRRFRFFQTQGEPGQSAQRAGMSG